MKSKLSILIIIMSLIIAIGLLTGCGSAHAPVPTNTRISTNMPTLTSIRRTTTTPKPTSTRTSTITATLTSTPLPTLSKSESEKYVKELLENNRRCSLPCIWGIIPGETSYYDAQQFFIRLGWKGSEAHGAYYTRKDIETFAIVLDVGINAPNGIVKKQHIAVSGRDYLNQVKYFSFENMLKELGLPKEIFVFVGTSPGFLEPHQTSFEILLYYENRNTLIKYTGTSSRYGDYYRVCPNRPNAKSTQVDPNSGNVSIFVGEIDQTDTPQDLVRPFWVLPSYYLPVDKAFGTSIEEFYEKASQNNDNVCFDSPLIAWQR